MPKIILDARISQSVDKPGAATSTFSLSGAATAGFIKAESAVDPVTGVALATNDIVPYCVSADSLAEWGWGVVDKTAHTITRNPIGTINAGTRGTTTKLDFSGASATPTLRVDFSAWLAMSELNNMRREPGVRPTLTANTPVTTTDVTGGSATTIYAEPVAGGNVPLFMDAAGLVPYVAKLPANTVSKALGTLASGSIPNDIFLDYGVTSAGTWSITLVPWTSTTARATAVDKVDGIEYKNGDYRFIWIGTFIPTSTTQTEDSKAKRFLFSAWQQVEKELYVTDTTSHTYGTGTNRQYRATTTNKLEWCSGRVQDAVTLYLKQYFTSSGGAADTGLVYLTTDPAFGGAAAGDTAYLRGRLSASMDEMHEGSRTYLPTLGLNSVGVGQYGLNTTVAFFAMTAHGRVKC